MASVTDDRGYNQGYIPTLALGARTDRRCQAMIGEMDLSKPRKILELGCGTGELSNLLATKTQAVVVGSDLCKSFIEQARHNYQRANLSFNVVDLKSKDQVHSISEQFDYVVGNGILHHIYNELDELLPQLATLIKPKGKLIFWEPNLLNPYVFLIFKLKPLRRLAKLEPDEMAFTSGFIRKKLERAGFTNIKAITRDFLLPNTPDRLITPIIKLGDVLEKSALSRWSAQSIFISAERT